jgi:hypothetical protein
MKLTLIRTMKRTSIIAFVIAMNSLIALSAEKISLSSGYGIDPARWSAAAGNGTISSNGTTVVLGTGTEFTTQLFGLPAGSLLYINGVLIGTVLSITDNSTLLLDAPPVGGAFTGKAFTHQTVPMPGDNVTISAGDVVSIVGWMGMTINDLTIKGTGSLETDANLFNITGNVLIDGAFIQDPGCRIIMDGTASTIGGAVWPVTLRSLRVKTTVLPAVVTLHAPLVVTERLDVEDGTIGLNSQSLTIGTGAAAPGALLAHAAKYQHINGPGSMTRWFAPAVVSMTDTTSSFPLSAGNISRSMWISGTVTLGGTISIAQTELTGTTPISIIDNARVFTQRLNLSWTVSCGNGFTGNTLALRLQASALPGVSSITDLTMSGSTALAAGTFSPSTIGAAPSDYQVNRTFSNQTVLPGTFYIAVTADSPLPVELASFSAAVKNKAIVLQWKTATESDNYGFEIERRTKSSTGALQSGDWTVLGFTAGQGTTNVAHAYSYIDNTANGSYAYRLKQIDRDGRFAYSTEVEGVLSTPAAFALVQNYPNPFNPSTRIAFTVPAAGHATLRIFNAIGQEVATLYNGEAKAGGDNIVQFYASGLTTGMYFSRLEYDGKTQVMKMQLIK